MYNASLVPLMSDINYLACFWAPFQFCARIWWNLKMLSLLQLALNNSATLETRKVRRVQISMWHWDYVRTNIHRRSILLLLSPFPSKRCQPVLCAYGWISAVSASSRYVACFLVKLFLIAVSLAFGCCGLFSASSLPFPQLSSFCHYSRATTATTAVPTSSTHATRSPLLAMLAVSHTVTFPLNSCRRAFERDTDTNTEHAPMAAHNDKGL